jgi:hypothetical protein
MKYVFFIAIIFLPLMGYANERELISYYHSEIEVQKDGSLLVQETIKVHSLGEEIKRGIFRSFPVIYRDRLNNRIRVGFQVHEVLKDDEPAPYTIISEGDFKVIRIGDPDVLLEPGEHTYQITYSTSQQIGFFEEYDEIYWNAIGDHWAFPILSASARVHIPEGTEILQYSAYAGRAGNQDCPCVITQESARTLFVEVKETLSPGHALTVAVAWPKGIIPAPSSQDRARKFIRDNLGFFIAVFGTLLVWGYYFFAWKKVGRDPKKGNIYPQFESPEGLNAAACRFVHKMGFDPTCFSAAIVELATKGHLKIEEISKRKFQLKRTGNPLKKLNNADKNLLESLFPGERKELLLDQKEHQLIRNGLNRLKSHLKANYKDAYFRLNREWLVYGIIFTIITVLLTLVFTFPFRLTDETGFLVIGSFFALSISSILYLIVFSFISWREGVPKKKGGIIGLILVSFFFCVIPLLVILSWAESFDLGILLAFVLLFFANFLFSYLLKAPTPEGREVMDDIEGFRMYLNTAEKPLLQHLNPPGLTPEVFEKYLPYAIGLGVGEAWGKSFENAIKMGEVDMQKSGYTPRWYQGAAFSTASLGGFSNTLSSTFSQSLRNSATAPGSSSGSGGGGRSGGGGGGGGGGGW